MTALLNELEQEIRASVAVALKEDLGSGDVTAALIPENEICQATILTREDCTVCGVAWVEESFRQLGGLEKFDWHVQDGNKVGANTVLVTMHGNARTLLTGERTALNFLQLLSGVATKSSDYAALVKGTNIKILDTRKTVPGLRHAQKYAVAVGGCFNHRMALYDAYLIKENHIAACGGITSAVELARVRHPELPVIVEAETIEELKEAIRANADRIMLDNFSDEDLAAAAGLKASGVLYEVSGNVTPARVKQLVEWDIDCISIGDLTKNVRCVDLSMGVEISKI